MVTMMRRLCAIGILSWLCLTSLPAQSPKEGKPEAWQSERLDVQVPTRDGRKLVADLFLPDKPGKYPVVLVQTPYNKNRFRRILRAAPTPEQFTDRQQYGYMIVDWRGFFGSKAAKRPLRRADRGKDGYDTVEWVATQDFCNGKVGTWGGSALGKAQFSTAIEQPPHLVCAVPSIATMGQAYEGYYTGGVLLEHRVKTLDRLGFGVSKMVKRFPLPDARIWERVQQGSSHPDKVEIPMLLVTGWWDHFPGGVLQTYQDLLREGGEATKKHSRLIIGPWDHMSVGKEKQGQLRFAEATQALPELTAMFFDHWLRGKKNKLAAEPRIRYWQLGEGKWVGVEEWPSAPKKLQSFYLQADGKLTTEPVAKSGKRSFQHDPKDPSPTKGGANLPPLQHGPYDQKKVAQRKDVLVYQTEVLQEAVKMVGEPQVNLSFSCNRVDCDLAVRLCDVHADGRAYLISDGIQRAKLRNGKVELLQPGKSYSLTITLPTVAISFEKGHRIQLIVSAANHPRYERNSHTGADHYNAKAALDVQVELKHGGEADSRLLLPVR